MDGAYREWSLIESDAVCGGMMVVLRDRAFL